METKIKANASQLMKRTKKELIEIIIKNDSVIASLENDLQGTELSLKDYRQKFEEMKETNEANNKTLDDLLDKYLRTKANLSIYRIIAAIAILISILVIVF